MNRRDARVADCIELLRTSDPDCAVARGRYRINFIQTQSLAIRQRHDTAVVKGIQATGRDVRQILTGAPGWETFCRLAT